MQSGHDRGDALQLSHPSHVMRFSTDDLPQKDRLAYFREEFGRGVCKVEYTPLTDEPFRARFDAALLPDCTLSRVDMSRTRSQRTPALIADGSDDLHLLIGQDGMNRITQGRREVMLSHGAAALLSVNEVGDGDASRLLSIGMSRQRLKAMTPGIEDRLLECIPQSTPALRLLTGHLHNWQHGEMATTPQMQQTFSDHLYDLVALLFNARGDVAEQAAQRGGREALRLMISSEIDRNFDDPDFSLPALARRVGIGPRYVQMLLAEADSSFVKEVTRRRLERAHALLRSPRHRHLSILDIAYECGFNTKTNFNQMFRRCYSATPGEIREGQPYPKQSFKRALENLNLDALDGTDEDVEGRQ